MTVRGRVDCYINPPADTSYWRRSQEIFGNITGFLSGSVLSDLGISIVSYNTGSGPGRGLDFWDARETNTGASANNFTWVVYRFNNAPRGKFDMLLLLVSGSGQSPAPFNVSTLASSAGNTIVGWACAVHPSGSATNPWNGPINAPGSGSLGTQIWNTSSVGTVGIFPRANSADGAYGVNRNFLAELHDNTPIIPMRMHIIATEGSFTVAQDYGLNNAYRIWHFGSYDPRPGTTSLIDAPYFMFTGRIAPSTNDSIALYNAVFGSAAGPSYGVGQDGGVTVPPLASGSKNVTFVTVGSSNAPDVNIGAFNSFVNSGSYEKLPLYVAASDGAFQGILGIADYVSMGFGMSPGVVNAASGTCALGRNVGLSLKVLVPWSGSSPGTLNNVRTGRTF